MEFLTPLLLGAIVGSGYIIYKKLIEPIGQLKDIYNSYTAPRTD
jgi:hypothetical protein